jgi:hypothetical protein
MGQAVMTDQVGVRFGLGNGVLFLLTGVTVAGRVPGPYGVGLLLVATAVLAVVLDLPHALGLGVAGWAFATGFAVHTLGVLTFTPPDLLRLVVFVLTAASASRLPDPARGTSPASRGAE